MESNVVATEASKITRAKGRDEEIQNFIQKNKVYFNDPLFVTGVYMRPKVQKGVVIIFRIQILA